MTNKEKFLALVSEEDAATAANNRQRIADREWLRASQHIALNILDRLEELGWSQKDLAQKMDVSPQQISKIVKGRENLTLDTITRLQNILDISILAGFQTGKQVTMAQVLPAHNINIVPSVLNKAEYTTRLHVKTSSDKGGTMSDSQGQYALKQTA